MGMGKILIAGPACAELAAATRLARAAGATVLRAETAASAAAQLRQDAGIDLLLFDLSCGLANLLDQLRCARISIPVIATGATLSVTDAVAAMKSGALDVLVPPVDEAGMQRVLAHLRRPDGGPLAQDPAMQAVLRLAEDIAPSDASVLITGESGTGKEVIARHIHARSHRREGPFIAVNCAAIPDGLLESELFGHEKGAFSGALARRIGKFEAASGGTLLLDELSEMDIRLQAKLLRVIQERVLDRVGGNAPVKVDVRLLATSNRDLPRACAEGKFREDLYFRLNVINIAIPPLRARPGDILPLAQRFARGFAALNGLAEKPLSAELRHALVTHRWPGNVRELENTMHRAVLLSHGAELHLPLTTQPAQPAPHATCQAPRPMNEVERDHIIATLNRTDGNRTHAAAMLGISLRALRNKLKAYAENGVAVPASGQINAEAAA